MPGLEILRRSTTVESCEWSTDRADVQALVFLAKKFPRKCPLITHSAFGPDYQVIYLDLTPEEIDTLTEPEINALLKRGISLVSNTNKLAIFKSVDTKR